MQCFKFNNFGHVWVKRPVCSPLLVATAPRAAPWHSDGARHTSASAANRDPALQLHRLHVLFSGQQRPMRRQRTLNEQVIQPLQTSSVNSNRPASHDKLKVATTALKHSLTELMGLRHKKHKWQSLQNCSERNEPQTTSPWAPQAAATTHDMVRAPSDI
jgi:hypothetical protein